jgi:hypothetical protein
MLKKGATATILCLICVVAFISSSIAAETAPKAASPLDDGIARLKGEISSYFIPVSGNVTAVKGDIATINRGASSDVKKGMRINVYKEGAPFVHPVTKERLGKIEIPIGLLEVTSAADASSKARIISGKASEFKGAKIKVAGRKVRVLFFQGNTDWNLADTYHQALQASGRFELIDTALQTATDAELMAEAKKKEADVALRLESAAQKNTLDLFQKIYWASDGNRFSEASIVIPIASVKQLKFGPGAFAWKKGEAMLIYKLPIGANRMAIGDFSGSKQYDIVFVTDNRVAVYRMDIDLKLLWEFKTPMNSGDILWVDTLDVNGDGRDEILVTTAKGVRSTLESYSTGDDVYQAGKSKDDMGSVRSFVYAFDKGAFKQIWRGENMFIRALENKMVSQAFSSSEGFDGNLIPIEYDNGKFTAGKPTRITKGLNIYDFQYVYAPDGRKGYFAWDENGFVNFYNDKNVKTWVSKESFGGFSDTFKKESGSIMLDKGSWSMKDKFVTANSEVLAPLRKALLDMVDIKSLGYSSSAVRSFWWNGITVEERSYLDEIDGTILDYTVVGDKLLVLIKPYLLSFDTVKTIIKGENPLNIMLYVFSTKGR